MREILFRGKRDDGEWVEGYFVHCKSIYDDETGRTAEIIPHNADRIYDGEYSPYDVHKVILETVGQFTGLTDKNGTKIFEGDLFQMEDDIIADVIFKDGCFRLELHGLCGTWTESGFDECGGGYGIIECDPIDWYCIRDMEVSGNIYDNPELLEANQ